MGYKEAICSQEVLDNNCGIVPKQTLVASAVSARASHDAIKPVFGHAQTI